MLRFAYNTNGTAHHRLDDALALIADAGYDGVALTLDHHHLDPFAPDFPGRARALSRRLRALGLGLVVETGARYLLDPRQKHEPTLVSPAADGRARRVDFLRRCLDVCAECGGETVSFWAGVPRPGVDREAAWGWLEEGVAAVAALAAERGVAASLEPEPGMLVETVDDFYRLRLAAPSLRLALDTGHCLVTGDRDPAAAVRETAADLGTVAVEDMRRGVHEHLPFGEGDMDTPAVLAALDDVGFRGLVTVELSRDSHRAHEMVGSALAYLRRAAARARRHRAALMRICFLSRRFFPAVSGMSVYAANLLRELVRTGHDVTMVSQYRGDAAGTRVYGGGPPPPVPGVRVVGLESLGEQDGGDFERDVEAMVDAVLAEHARRPFDLLHAQYGYPPGLAALEASRRLGVPNVVSIQGGDGHWVGPCCATHRSAMRAVLDDAGALLIGSRSFADEVHENHGTPPDRFTIVPGAVDVERFRPRDGWRAGALCADGADSADGGEAVLLYHGRVDRRKGALDLLDAFARLPRGGSARAARLVVSGVGPDSAAVVERVAALGIGDRVAVRGPVAYDDVPAVYRAADVFVSPTYAEGFSNTILEAMASGLPIVSTRAVGVVDCLRDDENALLVPPGDVGALAAALARVLADRALRARLAGAALDEARRLYAWPAVARQIEGVYARLAGTPPDTNWTVDATRAPCRFRAAPHLL